VRNLPELLNLADRYESRPELRRAAAYQLNNKPCERSGIFWIAEHFRGAADVEL
jgi:hypothetical protein